MKTTKIALAIGIAIAIPVLCWTIGTRTVAEEPPKPPVVLNPALVPICSCESRQGKKGVPTHYEADGVTVLRGRENPDDVGMCQINLHYHKETATKMDLDLFKREDNITYANWLYEKEGSTPWNWSRSCWE